MFHLVANTIALGTTANTAVPAIQDDFIPRNSTTNNFMLPQDMDLVAAAAMSATLNRVRINTPTLRMITLPFIRPVFVNALPQAQGRIALYLDQPFRLPAWEELAIEATSDIAMGTERFNSLMWLAMGLDPIPPGRIFTMRATSTTAAVANAWTTIAYTMADNLPPGTYALVSSECISTNGIAHRWNIPNQIMRPGFLSHGALGDAAGLSQMGRQFGLMGTFVNTNLPQAQVLCNAADAVHTLYMQLVKIG